MSRSCGNVETIFDERGCRKAAHQLRVEMSDRSATMYGVNDIDAYWNLIADARAAVEDPDAEGAVADAVYDALLALPPERILAHHRAQWTVMSTSYSWRLWHAAYQINGGCSDDGFEYFRGWLLSTGRDVFTAAVDEPDSLADAPAVRAALAAGRDLEDEDMMGATASAYHRVTGDYPPHDDDAPPYPNLGPGWEFDDDTEYATRLPRLYALLS
jgi:hypothetical protein